MNPAPMPYVTALYAGLSGVLLLVLGARVSQLRRRFGVGIGDGGNPALARAIRVHGNAVEWLLPALLLLLVAELNRAAPLLLHAAGAAIVVGRVLHAAGLSGATGYSFGRFAGSGISWLAVLALALWNLWAFLRVAML
jgi:uncharacterized membrane protein YecN with MAPEG domain